MDRLMDGWADARRHARRDGRTDGRTGGRMDGWVGGRTGRWTDGWKTDLFFARLPMNKAGREASKLIRNGRLRGARTQEMKL